MKNQIFKRSRTAWKTEKEAFTDLAAKQSLQNKEVTAKHTDKHFVWEIHPEEKSIKNVFEVEINKVPNEQIATEKAMEYFQTFEGNLKSSHTKTKYIFSKVRQ